MNESDKRLQRLKSVLFFFFKCFNKFCVDSVSRPIKRNHLSYAPTSPNGNAFSSSVTMCRAPSPPLRDQMPPTAISRPSHQSQKAIVHLYKRYVCKLFVRDLSMPSTKSSHSRLVNLVMHFAKA